MNKFLPYIFVFFTVILSLANILASFYSIGIWRITGLNMIGVMLYFIFLKFLINRRPNAFGYSEQRKWADSIYFLGFMMTLVALIVAFNQAYYASGGALIAQNLVQSAIALSSTAVALLLRQFWVLSLSDDQQDLNVINQEIEEFRSSLHSMKQATSEHLKFMAKSNEDFDKSVRIQVEKTSRHLLKVSEAHVEALATVDERLRKVNDDYRRSVLSEVAKHNGRRSSMKSTLGWLRSRFTGR